MLNNYSELIYLNRASFNFLAISFQQNPYIYSMLKDLQKLIQNINFD